MDTKPERDRRRNLENMHETQAIVRPLAPVESSERSERILQIRTHQFHGGRMFSTIGWEAWVAVRNVRKKR